jgi:uncharacterized cofD-like protein
MKKIRRPKLPKIVVIGGGTGSFAALSGLKKYPVQLSAIVTMMDSGGSSGRLRDELGVLPPGDIRQCLVALSGSSRLLRELFNYRFPKGDLKGHNFGNIFLSALEKTTGDFEKAILEVGKILRIQGRVIPVTFKKADLCALLVNGKRIVGQTHVDVVEGKVKRAAIKKVYLKPSVSANPQALEAIKEANLILIGPGDLYTSIIPNLLVKGVPSALTKSRAKKVYVLNLMTKYGQTTDYTARKHIEILENYLGKNVLDLVLLNKRKPTKKALRWYLKFEEAPVVDDLDSSAKVLRANLIKDLIIEKDKGDLLRRSIIRHDPQKLARALLKLL